jgi:hypothetical protein
VIAALREQLMLQRLQALQPWKHGPFAERIEEHAYRRVAR